MSKKYTVLAQVFKDIVESLAGGHSPNRRYVVPPEFTELFGKAFPESDGDPANVDDAEIQAFVEREVLISRKVSLTMGQTGAISLEQLEDPRTRMN